MALAVVVKSSSYEELGDEQRWDICLPHGRRNLDCVAAVAFQDQSVLFDGASHSASTWARGERTASPCRSGRTLAKEEVGEGVKQDVGRGLEAEGQVQRYCLEDVLCLTCADGELQLFHIQDGSHDPGLLHAITGTCK